LRPGFAAYGIVIIHNERTKLLATALNNVAVAAFVTGFIAPIVGFLYGSPTATATRWWWLIGIVWLLVGVGLHTTAQAVLGKLRQ
jgi:hypothetical protein